MAGTVCTGVVDQRIAELRTFFATGDGMTSSDVGDLTAVTQDGCTERDVMTNIRFER